MGDLPVIVERTGVPRRRVMDAVLLAVPVALTAGIVTLGGSGLGTALSAAAAAAMGLLLLRAAARGVDRVELDAQVLRARRLWTRRTVGYPLEKLLHLRTRLGVRPGERGSRVDVRSVRLEFLGGESLFLGRDAMPGMDRMVHCLTAAEPGHVPLPLALGGGLLAGVVFYRGQPGLGRRAGYLLPGGVGVAIQVYNRGLASVPDGTESAAVQEELAAARREMPQAEPDVRRVHMGNLDDSLPLLLLAGPAGPGRVCRTYLRGHRGHFLKLEVTAPGPGADLDGVLGPLLQALETVLRSA